MGIIGGSNIKQKCRIKNFQPEISDKFLFDTEAINYEKVLQNLSRFTLAGDFKVNDLTENFECVSVRGKDFSNFKIQIPTDFEIVETDFNGEKVFIIRAFRGRGFDVFIPKPQARNFIKELESCGAVLIGGEAREVLRVENGEPLYGIDIDEANVVLETGLDEAAAGGLLKAAGDDLRVALVMHRGKVNRQTAEIELSRTNFVVEKALSSLR